MVLLIGGDLRWTYRHILIICLRLHISIEMKHQEVLCLLYIIHPYPFMYLMPELPKKHTEPALKTHQSHPSTHTIPSKSYIRDPVSYPQHSRVEPPHCQSSSFAIPSKNNGDKHNSTCIDSALLEKLIIFIIVCNYKGMVNHLEDKASMVIDIVNNCFTPLFISIILHHRFLTSLIHYMIKFPHDFFHLYSGMPRASMLMGIHSLIL